MPGSTDCEHPGRTEIYDARYHAGFRGEHNFTEVFILFVNMSYLKF
jgi:hypothetical protein